MIEALKVLFGQAGADAMTAASALELAPLELLSAQAAGAKPLAATAVLREQARRTGRQAPLDRAESLAEREIAGARGRRLRAARLDLARTLMLRAELFGLSAVRERLEAAITACGGNRLTPVEAAALAGLVGRKAALDAYAEETAEGLLAAGALLDAACEKLRPLRATEPDAAEALLARSGLAFIAGVKLGQPELLDQAGEDLRLIVEENDEDLRPLTRARALALCGAGLSFLSEWAGDDAGVERGLALMEAAAEVFTEDHSPLDAVAVNLSLGLALERAGADGLAHLSRAALGAGGDGAHVELRARAAWLDARLSRAARDPARAQRLKRELVTGLGAPRSQAQRLRWAIDQIALARLSGERRPGADMALLEAEDILKEADLFDLARRAGAELKAPQGSAAP
ncbi:hypothetical protein Q0812_01460 [Brevundimonas sp. 2R-24]|uniref:Uncharacterized protein n=1 Tax=Peiella sedimenti TaxID=3061083 RepID=A0ABT8SJ63_9CAUL|nr:hypothetical protein [Caulobacteraceae bacterium XZ-24]